MATSLDDDSGIVLPDGATGHDAGMIVPGVDSGLPGVDSGGITPITDAGPGPGTDSGRPPRPDSGTTMMGSDSGTTMGVMCGTSVCGASEVCCVTRGAGMMVSETCTAAGACMGFPVSCDGPEDCMSGEACCGAAGPGGGGSAQCAPDTMCFVRLCHVTADCPNPGDMCCSFMGANVCSPRCF